MLVQHYLNNFMIVQHKIFRTKNIKASVRNTHIDIETTRFLKTKIFLHRDFANSSICVLQFNLGSRWIPKNFTDCFISTFVYISQR